jgi:hypothetical protein
MTTLDATDPSGLTLRIEFVGLADRYAHVLSVVEPDGEVHPILESVEGTATDDWPSSPPLQNLSIEELSPGRLAALLVGLAGRSHWSASIEPVPGQAALDFDIACRWASSVGPLGSAYALAAGLRHIAQFSGNSTVSAELQVAVADNLRLHVKTCAEFECRATLAKARVLIVPLVPSQPKPGTGRWKYRIALARA